MKINTGGTVVVERLEPLLMNKECVEKMVFDLKWSIVASYESVISDEPSLWWEANAGPLVV